MNKILTLLLAGAALIPSFSYAHEEICAANVYIQGIATTPDHQLNSWKITYSKKMDGDETTTISSDMGGRLNFTSAHGRAIYAMAMNAMNMKQKITLIDLHHYGRDNLCDDFTGLVLGDTPPWLPRDWEEYLRSHGEL